MTPFTAFTGIAAPLLLENVDTDLIIPKQFLKTLTRAGLGRHLFHDLRYEEDGREKGDFVLNQAPYRCSTLLLGGANFGCGSSREHAPWALMDFGIRCIVAPSFADIFYTNCFQNGLLPAIVSRETLAALADFGDPITVDLPQQCLWAGTTPHPFHIPPHRKQALLLGLDNIGQTEAILPTILRFEAARTQHAPWLNDAGTGSVIQRP